MGQIAGADVITPLRGSKLVNGTDYPAYKVVAVIGLLDRLRAESTLDYIMLARICHYRHLKLPSDSQRLLLEIGLIQIEDGVVVTPPEVRDVVVAVSEPDKLYLYDTSRLF